MYKNLIYALFAVLITVSTYGLPQNRGGLRFQSYEVKKESRTSMNLSPDKPFELKNGFELDFDINFNSSITHTFGYVCRLTGEEGEHIDIILNDMDKSGQNVAVSLISSSYDIDFNRLFEAPDLTFDKYIHVKLLVDIQNDNVEFSVGDKKFSKRTSSLEAMGKIDIVFGKNTGHEFQTTDIPSFTLKNLSISSIRGKQLYSWPLVRHTEDGVYDEIRHRFASCTDPVWLLDKHVFWQLAQKIETGQNPRICFNPEKNEIAVADNNSFTTYSLNTGAIDRQMPDNNLVFTVSNSNNLIWNPISESYDYYYIEDDSDKRIFHYDNGDWNDGLVSSSQPSFWHHNRLFSMLDSCLYIIGGYGYHQYKNEANMFDYRNGEWSHISFKGDRIAPRYLSCIGQVSNQEIMLFGGYGSMTGKQAISPQFFYDLYSINIRTREAKKMWTMQYPEDDFVVSNSMIYDSDERAFYTLAYPSQQYVSKIRLLKFSIDNPVYEVVGSELPFNFDDVRSYADLYMDKQNNRLVAVTASPQSDSLCSVSIYTLTYEPLSADDLWQTQANGCRYGLIAALIAMAIVSGGIIIRRRRKAKKSREPKIRTEVSEQPLSQDGEIQPVVTPNKSAIYVYGGFMVLDRNGNDITGEFTPMLKQMFVLLLLNTCKNEKGISSAKLKDLLWFDKSDESAKNNRGVLVNKLRQVMETVGDVQISHKDMFWGITLQGVYFDYARMRELIDRISNEDSVLDIGDIVELVSIVSKGEMLPNLQIDWIDSFKSDASNTIIDALLLVWHRYGTQLSPEICILMADAIFLNDPLNEEAVSIKCKSLIRSGKVGLAQKIYQNFTREYCQMLGETYDKSFKSVVSE